MTNSPNADGSGYIEISNPVDAHVAAVWLHTDTPYSDAVATLLSLGVIPTLDNLPAQTASLPFDDSHVPELIRMARDHALYQGDQDNPATWAPTWALLALGKLDVRAHIAELIPLFDIDDEWVSEELPPIIGRAGEAALGPLTTYLQDRSRWLFGRASAANALTEVARNTPELRDSAIQALTQILNQAEFESPALNALVIVNLIALQAVEALPVIRRAFELDTVEEFTVGDWIDVLKAMGQMPQPDDPLVALSTQRRNEYSQTLQPSFTTKADIPAHGPSRRSSTAAKKKTKRKTEKASRKANRKKRR